jgi:CheY-like chemotaxis protein
MDERGADGRRVMANTMLYVEDDENNVRLIERILKRRPTIDLVVAASGSEGLRRAQETALRLILLDRRLPDMVGDEVLRQLKASPLTVSIPVVMLSGDTGPDTVAETRRLGAVEFLPKPFDVLQLLSIVDRFCG